MYLYKGVDVNFFIMFKILLSKFYQELPCGKVKLNLLGEFMFCITLKEIFLGLKFLILH